MYSLTSDNCHFSAAVIPAIEAGLLKKNKKTYKSSNLYETSEIFAFLIQEQREQHLSGDTREGSWSWKGFHIVTAKNTAQTDTGQQRQTQCATYLFTCITVNEI